MSRALDALLSGVRKIFNNGVEQTTTSAVDLIGANWDTAYNPNTGRLEIQATNAVDLGAITRTLWVDAGYGGGSSDGTQGKPYTTIQDALDQVPVTATANYNLTQILVAPGTYSGNPEVLANQQVVITALSGNNSPLNPPSCPVIMTGHFVWTLSAGAAGLSVLTVRGVQFDGINIAATAVASSPVLEFTGCSLTGAVSATGTYSAAATLVGCACTDIALPDASVIGLQNSIVSGELTMGTVLQATNTTFQGVLNLQTFVVMRECSITNTATFSIAAGALTLIDDSTLRYAALSGILPAPTEPSGGNVWQGGAGYYNFQHTVRYTTGDVTADLGDETIYVNPGSGNTKTVTLPDASMFAASTADTVGGISHTPARRIVVKNVCPETSTVLVVASGTDKMDGAASASTHFLLPMASVELVPYYDGANWNWASNGKINKTHAQDLTQSTENAGIFSDKLQFVSGNLNGWYRVDWDGVSSVDNVDTICGVQLVNDTTSTLLGTLHLSGTSTDINWRVGGTAFVQFSSGVSTTLKVQFRRESGTGNAIFENATLTVQRAWA